MTTADATAQNQENGEKVSINPTTTIRRQQQKEFWFCGCHTFLRLLADRWTIWALAVACKVSRLIQLVTGRHLLLQWQTKERRRQVSSIRWAVLLTRLNVTWPLYHFVPSKLS